MLVSKKQNYKSVVKKETKSLYSLQNYIFCIYNLNFANIILPFNYICLFLYFLFVMISQLKISTALVVICVVGASVPLFFIFPEGSRPSMFQPRPCSEARIFSVDARVKGPEQRAMNLRLFPHVSLRTYLLASLLWIRVSWNRWVWLLEMFQRLEWTSSVLAGPGPSQPCFEVAFAPLRSRLRDKPRFLGSFSC